MELKSERVRLFDSRAGQGSFVVYKMNSTDFDPTTFDIASDSSSKVWTKLIVVNAGFQSDKTITRYRELFKKQRCFANSRKKARFFEEKELVSVSALGNSGFAVGAAVFVVSAHKIG